MWVTPLRLIALNLLPCSGAVTLGRGSCPGTCPHGVGTQGRGRGNRGSLLEGTNEAEIKNGKEKEKEREAKIEIQIEIQILELREGVTLLLSLYCAALKLYPLNKPS